VQEACLSRGGGEWCIESILFITESHNTHHLNNGILRTTNQLPMWAVGRDENKSLYLVFVEVVFFSASWTVFIAVRTTSWTAFKVVRTATS
jgi:hypothetical protein